MSLINDMLKDLDKQKSNKPTDDASMPPPELVASKGKKRFFINRTVWLILVLLILAVVVFFIKTKTKEPSSSKVSDVFSQVMRENKSMPMVNEAQQKQEPEINSAVLSDASIKTEGIKTFLILDLTHKVHYQIDKISDDHLLLTLNNVDFKGVLPGVTGSAIQAISSKNLHKDFLLDIFLRSNTDVEGLQYDEQAEEHLILTLANTSIAQSGEVDKTLVPLSPKESAEENYQKAIDRVNQDRLDDAVSKLEEVVRDYPQYTLASKTLAILLIKQQHYQQALDVLNKALKIEPDALDLIKLKSRLYILEGKNKEALAVLQSVSPSLVEDPDFYALMANLQQRLGNHQVALQLYDQLLQANPRNSKWWLGLGMVYDSVDQPNAALQAYKNAVSAGSLSPKLLAYIQAKIDGRS